MANLSQMKREKMLAFLQGIKEQHSDDASLMAINHIEKEICSKKFGLVWEEHSEKVDEMLVDNIPVFTEDKTREILYLFSLLFGSKTIFYICHHHPKFSGNSHSESMQSGPLLLPQQRRIQARGYVCSYRSGSCPP